LFSHTSAYGNDRLVDCVVAFDPDVNVEKGALLWKALAMVLRGRVLALTGKPSDAVQPAVKHGAFWKHQLIRFAVESRT
jgi:hypothetical protein